MEKEIRWAIVGLGKISRRMLRAIRSVTGCRVEACVSSSKERAERYGERYNIPHRLTYDELAANPELVDAVYISTHMNAHAAPTKLYLSKKLPVLCEKSFAVSLKEAEDMIEAARASDTLLMEAMWTRFLPATLYVQELLGSGELGKIKSTTARFEVGIGHGPNSRVFKKELGGGSILDVGIYPTTYSHMLLGMPEKMTAHGRMRNGVDVNCNTTLFYPDGVTASYRVSTEFMTLKEFYRIECEKGTIIVPSFYDARKVIVKKSGEKRSVKRFQPRRERDGFCWEIEHFCDLIRSGKKESPVMTHKITLEVMTLIDEQIKSVAAND